MLGRKIVNVESFQRAQVAAFAYGQARHTGSLDCMKAVVCVFRNRLRCGWGDGTWQRLINSHAQYAGNVGGCVTEIELGDNLLRMLVRDIDDLYMGMSENDTGAVVKDALYYQFIDQEPNPWFVEKILHDPANHPRQGQIGPIALFK